MDIYSAFEKRFEDNAKTFPLGEGSEITLAPVAGDKSRRAFEQLMEPYSVRLNAGLKLTDDENKALNVKFYAENIVKGWKGLKDAAGEEIEFSVDRCKALLADPKLEGFFALIIRISTNDASFERTKVESDEGNSSLT